MTHNISPEHESNGPAEYQIRIQGHLGPEWSGWFQDMTVTLGEHGQTLVSGSIADQSALHGLLRQVRDLGLPLLSVVRIEPCVKGEPDDR